MAQLKVVNVPPFVTPDEMSRLFMQLDGCTGSSLIKQPNGE